MNCPECNRVLGPMLSICPSCGTMMFDSVREELKDKVSVLPRPVETRPQPVAQPVARPAANPPVSIADHRPPAPAPVAPPPAEPELEVIRVETAQITAKPTSPTLVDFQPRHTAIPEWRLQIQNAVRKRLENSSDPEPGPVPAVQPAVSVSGGTGAARAVAVRRESPAPVAEPENERIAKVVQRIEESRRRYLESEPTLPVREPAPVQAPAQAPAQTPAPRAYPLYVAQRNREIPARQTEQKSEPAPIGGYTPASIIEDLPIISKKDLDTNKLRPLPNSAVISTGIERTGIHDTNSPGMTAPVISISRTAGDEPEEEVEAYGETVAGETEEYDDLAPLSLRFSAAAFDLVIGAIGSLVLLSPFVLSGGNWLSLAGIAAAGVTFAIVMFIYLTTSVGFYGQTLGMRIFSLEVIDIEDEEYPTLHQAAVNTSVYLASLIFGGVGFIPALFNDEKRAAHDLLAGTVVVREEF